MIEKQAYIGYGSFGKQVHSLRNSEERNSEDIFFDDFCNEKKNGKMFPFNSYLDFKNENYEYYVCLGYHHLELRKKIIGELLENHCKVGSVIHPYGFIHDTAKVSQGCIIFPNHNIDLNVVLNHGVIVHNSVTVSHDSVIGACSFLSPGCLICGNTHIGEKTFIGAGSIVRDGVEIGSGVKIGIGTVVTNDIQNGKSVIGNPMKILRHEIHL